MIEELVMMFLVAACIQKIERINEQFNDPISKQYGYTPSLSKKEEEVSLACEEIVMMQASEHFHGGPGTST